MKKDGFALLYAILVTTIVLSLGLILSTIITKQLVISSIATHSQLSFYAATAGMECAENNDLKFLFGELIEDVEAGTIEYIEDYLGVPTAEDIGDLKCSGLELVEGESLYTLINTNEGRHYQFTQYLNNPTNSCAIVDVVLDINEGDEIAIRSRGYSVSGGSVVNDCGQSSNPRLVERIIYVNKPVFNN